ncbi:sugar ABC transporter substrate-binding protein [Nakamurella endophytica]|uniref:Sugar ABC transporter substrate-binding protein n=1 Tax=Nakamurella endophytica TaxID=1748367 RepID=A0A917WDM4_9ACTN|nr:substrate-binding domain-containing protein [Nakamurella endophytica]GGL93299.1 sugar ABC transporter substrate-binding protein [Nakamurella endophytica]
MGVAAYTQDPFWSSLQCGATKQAEAMGSKITWYSSATDTSSATQQANYNAAMLTNPDALLLASWQVGTFSTQVKDLMQKGTPVIGVNSTITPATERVLFVNGEDNSEFVKYIADELKGQSGSIAVLGGTAGVEDAVRRWKPVIDGLATTAPNLKALPTQYDDFDRTKAATAASAMIVAHPDLKAIYAISGPEGEGAGAAVQQAGKAGQIKVYSYGANEAEVAGLKSGVFSALMGQPAYGLGQEGVKAAISYLQSAKKGEPVPKLDPQVVDVPLKVLNKANVDAPENVAYLQKSGCS